MTIRVFEAVNPDRLTKFRSSLCKILKFFLYFMHLSDAALHAVLRYGLHLYNFLLACLEKVKNLRRFLQNLEHAQACHQ